MKVSVWLEEGYEIAVLGLALSYHDRKEPLEEWYTPERQEKAAARAAKLAHRQGGHNKFLESIVVWIDVEASRAWWSEMDTYRVGTTKQSESTMHTLSKRAPEVADFEVGTSLGVVKAFRKVWAMSKDNVTALKMNLPEGFLQRRIICTNYKVLQNVIAQRLGHRLQWWDVFINEVLNQVEHPEFLVEQLKQEYGK